MTSIAFVTTCRQRLHHIRQTLPIIAGTKAAEVILVDYGCPDNSGDWAEANHPAVKVVRVTDDPVFWAARARNMGAAAASAEWLVMIDGDILIQPEWLDWMQANIKAGEFYRAAPVAERRRDPDTYGTVICRRADFMAV
jgi:glycosyltransferase involved in cell wall biosynthesis